MVVTSAQVSGSTTIDHEKLRTNIGFKDLEDNSCDKDRLEYYIWLAKLADNGKSPRFSSQMVLASCKRTKENQMLPSGEAR
jgi:hypothetical protein